MSEDAATIENLTQAQAMAALGYTDRGEFARLLGVDEMRPRRRLSQRQTRKLGLTDDVASPPGGPETATSSPPRPDDGLDGPPTDFGRADERPPSMPSDAKQAPLPMATAQLAAERIGQAHAFIGGGLAMGMGEPRVGQVFDRYSPQVGQAWVKAAEENEFARRVVNLMAAGGATGELVMSYVVLIGGVLYVTGRADPLAGIYERQFGPPPAPPAPPAAPAEPAATASNGSEPPAPFAPAPGDLMGEAAGQAAP